MRTSNPAASPLVSKEAWPANGIGTYRAINDGPWGYLLLYADGRFEFDPHTRPTNAEILDRWSSYLTEEVGITNADR